MQTTVKDKIAVIQDAEEDMLSSLPRIKDYLNLLEEVVSNTSKEFKSILKQIGEEELKEKEAIQTINSPRELARDIRIRLMEAVAAFEEREPPNTIEGSRANLLERAAASNEETTGRDSPELILSNTRELETLQKLKMSLKRFLIQMSRGDVQEHISWSNIFPDVPESVITVRIRQLYSKYEKSLLNVYGNPIDALVGLINNQMLLVTHQITMIEEVMSPGPSRERTPVADHGSEEYIPSRHKEASPTDTQTPID